MRCHAPCRLTLTSSAWTWSNGRSVLVSFDSRTSLAPRVSLLWFLALNGPSSENIMFNSVKIVAAFRGMHVSPVKHSYAWLPRKCDYQTDTLFPVTIAKRLEIVNRYFVIFTMVSYFLRWTLLKFFDSFPDN